MKTNFFILYIAIISFLSTSSLANELQINCINKQLHLKLIHTKLNLTEDAVVDNTGGYVDIPEEKLYLKSKKTLYPLHGKVIRNKQNSKELQAIINTSDLKKLSQEKSLKVIQKIELLENNKTYKTENIITTNKIEIVLNKNSLKEINNCF